MTQLGFWQRLSTWVLRRIHQLSLALAQWSEARLSATLSPKNLPQPSEIRQAGEAPADWLAKVQAASQPPAHWLDYVQSKTGQMPEMRNLGEVAQAPTKPTPQQLPQENPKLTPVERKAKLETVRSEIEELPRLRSNTAPTYQSPKQNIPAHLQWRIQKPVKSSFAPINQENAHPAKPISRNYRYQSPRQTAYHASLSFALQQALTVNLPNYALQAKRVNKVRLYFSQAKRARTNVPSYQSAAETHNESSPQYQPLASETSEKSLEYATRQNNHAVPVPAQSQSPVAPQKSTTVNDAEQTQAQNTDAAHYTALSQNKPSQADFPTLEHGKEVPANAAPIEKTATNTQPTPPQVNYPAAKNTIEGEPSYRRPSKTEIAEAAYQSPQEKAEALVKYPSQQTTPKKAATYPNLTQSSSNQSQYSRELPAADAYAAINSASTDFWIPLPAERNPSSPEKSALERHSRLDSEQRGEF